MRDRRLRSRTGTGAARPTPSPARASCPVSGAPIDNGTIVLRDGLIAQVGAGVSRAGRRGGHRRQGPDRVSRASSTWAARPASRCRPRRAPTTRRPPRTSSARSGRLLIRPQLRAAEHINPTAQPLARAAAAGITTILATPAGDAIRGQSALVNTALGARRAADRRRRRRAARPARRQESGRAARELRGTAGRRQRLSELADGRHRVRAPGVSRRAVSAGRRSSTTSRRKARDARPLYRSVARRDAARARRASCRSRSKPKRRARFCARSTWRRRSSSIRSSPTGAKPIRSLRDLKAANARVILSLNYPTRPQTTGARCRRAARHAPRARQRAEDGRARWTKPACRSRSRPAG